MGATTSTPPAARPTSPAPMRASTPSSPARSPAPTAAMRATIIPVRLRPRRRVSGRAPRVPRTMETPTTHTPGPVRRRGPPRRRERVPPRGPRGTDLPPMRTGGGEPGWVARCAADAGSWTSHRVRHGRQICVEIYSVQASTGTDAVERELRQCVRTGRSASIRSPRICRTSTSQPPPGIPGTAGTLLVPASTRRLRSTCRA